MGAIFREKKRNGKKMENQIKEMMQFNRPSRAAHAIQSRTDPSKASVRCNLQPVFQETLTYSSKLQ
jgi:hypothetical protein